MVQEVKLFKIESIIVAFGGKRGAGKDTCADILKRHILKCQYNKKGKVVETTAVNFADKLREVCADLFGMTLTQMVDPKLKETTLTTWPYQTPRHILQQFASEGIRGHWPDMWVRHWSARAKLELLCGDIVIATDLRFPNEREEIENLASQVGVPFVVINVERPSLNDQIDTHVSEMAAGRLGHHIEIVNDGDIEGLNKKVPYAVAEALRHYRSDMRRERETKKGEDHEAIT